MANYTINVTLTLIAALAGTNALAANKTVTGTIRIINPFAYSATVLPLDTVAGFGGGIIVGKANGVASAYINGQLTPLPGKTGYTNITPTGVSTNGYIVGSALSANNERGLFWSSYLSAPIDMGGLGAVNRPYAVNSSGVAVGEYRINADAYPQAFTWSRSGGIRSIAPPSSYQSTAFDISDTGYVAGFAWYGADQTATRWYPGTFTAGTAAYGSFAWRAMDDGTIFGYTTAWGLNNQPQFIAPNFVSLVYDINAGGRKVGTDIFATPRRGWTVPKGGSTAQYLPVPTGAVDSNANFVDSCGSILGSVSYADGSSKGVMWTKRNCDDLPVLTTAQ